RAVIELGLAFVVVFVDLIDDLVDVVVLIVFVVVVLIFVVIEEVVVLVLIVGEGRARRAVLVIVLGLLGARDWGVSSGLGGAGAVALGLGEQRRQRPREGVDLVRRQDRAVGEVRLLLGQQALESEQQRELAAPFDRWRDGTFFHLRHGSVERPASRGPRG